MKRKRLLPIFGCLAAMLLAGYVVLRLTTPSHRISAESFEAIQIGMTEQEVEAILGAGAGVHTSRCDTGSYFGRCGDPVLGMDMTKRQGVLRGKEWVTEDVSIYIFFDKNGLVARKCSGTGEPHGDESFLGKLRRWLGM